MLCCAVDLMWYCKLDNEHFTFHKRRGIASLADLLVDSQNVPSFSCLTCNEAMEIISKVTLLYVMLVFSSSPT